MTTAKKKYNFYISYWESFKALPTDKEKVEFMTLINKIHFFEEHIDRVTIKNANVKLLFVSIKHSLKASIQGYCDKKGVDYDGLFSTPCEGGYEGGSEPPYQQLIINNKQLEINNKKKEIKKEPLIFDKLKTLDELWDYWILNKAGKPFKNKSTEAVAKNKFLKWSNNSFEIGKSIIEYSVCGNYQGLFEPKKNFNKPVKSYQQQDGIPL